MKAYSIFDDFPSEAIEILQAADVEVTVHPLGVPRPDSAQMKAIDTEIRLPYHTASKVDWPEAPEPRIQWIVCPRRSMAAPGSRCLVDPSIRFTNGS